jgi:hypothetical protein
MSIAVEETAAVGGAAAAGDAKAVGHEAIVIREFLAGVDPAETEEKNMAAGSAIEKIGIATVVDAFGP